MTIVTFTMTREPQRTEDSSDPINAMIGRAGPFKVHTRSRHGPPWAKEWKVTLDGDLNAGQKTGLQTSLEATGRCVDVEFP